MSGGAACVQTAPEMAGRVALITGAAHGQGRAAALALAGESCHVAALDVARPLDSPGYAMGLSAELDTGSAREPLRELTLGRSRQAPGPPGPRTGRSSTEEEDDLGALAARCRAKAETARWAAERQRCTREQAENPDEDAPADPATGACAETLADAFYRACAGDPSGSPEGSHPDHVGCARPGSGAAPQGRWSPARYSFTARPTRRSRSPTAETS